MTDEEMRVKIAEDSGEWLFTPEADYIVVKDHGKIVMRFHQSKPDEIASCLDLAGVPDYLADLNAMREAENTLTPSQTIDYTGHLEKIVTSPHGYFSNWFMIHATARQRAEAFLRTVKPELF